MSISISAKQDYYYLFNNLPTSSGSSSNVSNLSSILSDYASIKNGSYTKLMKAYYNEVGSTSTSSSDSTKKDSTSTSTDTTKVLSSIESTTDDMKESADALIATGTDSLFDKSYVSNADGTTTYKYDVDSIYKAVSSFVDDYNDMIFAAADSNASTIKSKVSTIETLTDTYSSQLSKIGITVNSDSSLSISEDDFKSSDMSNVEDLFNGRNSYAYTIDSQSSMLNYLAQNEASRAATYTSTATYSIYNAGDIFSSYV